MTQLLILARATSLLLLSVGFFFLTGFAAFSEEFLFDLPLTRTVTQIEGGKSTRSSLREGDKGGPLFALKRRVFKEKDRYFYENTYEDGQIIKKEIKLLGNNPKQIWFYWPEDIAPRLIVFSKLSGSVAVLDVASFSKDHGDEKTKFPFTEIVLEYGRYSYKR